MNEELFAQLKEECALTAELCLINHVLAPMKSILTQLGGVRHDPALHMNLHYEMKQSALLLID